MKKSRWLGILVAVVIVAAVVFLQQSDKQKYMDELTGKWSMTVQQSEEWRVHLLESVNFYKEEIALIDSQLYYVVTVEFDAEGNYSFAEYGDDARECVRAFYLGAFEDLYEKRIQLDGVYDRDLDAMSEDEFRAFYANMYVKTDFDALLDSFVEDCYDYDSMGVTEYGTYAVDDGRITMDSAGASGNDTMTYYIDEDALTLIGSDGTEVYQRVPA